MNQHETIVGEIHRIIEVSDSIETITVLSVAQALQGKYAGEKEIDPYIAYASLEHFKQMARKELATKFDVDPKAIADATAPELDFERPQLQGRYPVPAPTSEERSYKRIEALSDFEVEWNAQRMERAGRTLVAHARQLRAWHIARKPEQA